MKILALGGSRFFGKKLVSKLLDAGHSVTVANRGNLDDGFGNRVSRVRTERSISLSLPEHQAYSLKCAQFY